MSKTDHYQWGYQAAVDDANKGRPNRANPVGVKVGTGRGEACELPKWDKPYCDGYRAGAVKFNN
jgi:hypothetical protein